MSLPFVSVPMSALDVPDGVGPEGLFRFGNKVYCFDNIDGDATHFRIVDFSTSTPTVGPVVTLAKAMASAPISGGSGTGCCVDGNGLIWTAFGVTPEIVGMSPTTGAVEVSYTPTGVTQSYCMSPVGTEYVASIVNDGANPPTWYVQFVDATAGTLYWQFQLPVPTGYSNYHDLVIFDAYVPNDGTTAYVLVWHESVLDSTVDDWFVFKLDISSKTSTEYDFHQGDPTIGGAYGMLLNTSNQNLILPTSGGSIAVVDGSTGSILNTYAGLTATLGDAEDSAYGTDPFQLVPYQMGVVDNTNDQFLVAAPTTAELRRIKLSTFTLIDDHVPPDDWIGAGYTSLSAVYAPFSPSAMMWTTTEYPLTTGLFALLELEWAASTPWKRVLTGGAFVDFSGNPIAFGELTLKLSADAASPAGQICAALKIKIPLDVNGDVAGTPSVMANDTMNPPNEYTVEVYTAEGQLCWGPMQQTVPSGSGTFDISTWVPGLWS